MISYKADSTNTTQPFPENKREGNTSYFIVWAQQNQMKIVQEKKTRTNILGDHRCKSPQENMINSNPGRYTMKTTPLSPY